MRRSCLGIPPYGCLKVTCPDKNKDSNVTFQNQVYNRGKLLAKCMSLTWSNIIDIFNVSFCCCKLSDQHLISSSICGQNQLFEKIYKTGKPLVLQLQYNDTFMCDILIHLRLCSNLEMYYFIAAFCSTFKKVHLPSLSPAKYKQLKSENEVEKVKKALK